MKTTEQSVRDLVNGFAHNYGIFRIVECLEKYCEDNYKALSPISRAQDLSDIWKKRQDIIHDCLERMIKET